MKEIFLASPRGFCAGVDRAIDVVETALKVYAEPLYVKHEIVHNSFVVKNLKDKGVIFVEDLADVPVGANVIFSAHGVGPQVVEQARQRQLNVTDATCPLVTKVHLEAKRYAKEDYQIILIGHKKHVEAIGTQGEAPERITIIETIEDIESLSFSKDDKIAYLTQTTLSVQDTTGIIEALKEKFPGIEGPGKSDICYATTNRQAAVSEIAEKVDIFLVVGSSNSSNSTRLKELAEKMGCKSYLVDNADGINADWIHDGIQKVGLTSGASAPEVLVQKVLERLKDEFHFEKVNEISVTTENVTFKLPKQLIEAGA